jgi:hypothetical protein
VRELRPLIPVVPLAFILPGPQFQPQQRASDADRDTAVDILCTAVAEGRRVGAGERRLPWAGDGRGKQATPGSVDGGTGLARGSR